MKRKSILMLCALTTFGAFAQKNLVDDVEDAIGGFNVKVDAYKAAAQNIIPALTNEETKNDAKTWFVASKANYGIYDQSEVSAQLGQSVDTLLMATSLMKAYDYSMTALPLDSVKETNKDGSYKYDKKGNIKVKTKYSKDIINELVGHYNNFYNAGLLFYNIGKYKEASDAWGVYVNMPTSGIAERDKFLVADTLLAEIEYNRGLASWQGNNLREALRLFESARNRGFKDKNAYDYALSCYVSLYNEENDSTALDGIVAIAKEAMPLYGDQDSQYITIIINDNVNKGRYEEARALIDQAIANNPTEASLYNLKGVTLEQLKDDEGALECFKKGVDLNPNLAMAQFNAGRMLIKKAFNLNEENSSLQGLQYKQFKETQIDPLYKEALPYMEKAYQLNPTDSQTKNLLSNVYYQLGMEAELESMGM